MLPRRATAKDFGMINFKEEQKETPEQDKFYETFLPRVDPAKTRDEILADSNDGVLNGNLLEFKRNTTDLNAHLFQCIKYLSARRIKGKPVPATILLVDLGAATVRRYCAEDYLADIEKVYFGGASKNNAGFFGGDAAETIDYRDPVGAERLVYLLKQKNFLRIHIDENCIVGWAEHFYRVVPSARKEDFIGDDTGKHKTVGEIRNPSVFKEYLYPYEGESNVRFKYLMDKLNDHQQKKDLGAFYTPSAYAEKSLGLVRAAIARVPAGDDYIILDRCAGTGNLESGLTEEELSHCIVSTVEYYEYKVLLELLGANVRHIIPPVETAETFRAGLVAGADALSREYIENPIIKQYLDDPHCTVILFENPPYAETTSAEHQRTGHSKTSSVWKQSYVVSEMKKEIKGTASNDLGNAFIWSAFKYYLRKPTDSYIVYSPAKYWKAQHLIHKKFMDGFAFNRRHFHTNIDACIMCVWWGNEEEKRAEIALSAFDIDPIRRDLLPQGTLPVKKIFSTYSQAYYDKRPIAEEFRTGILAGLNGLEKMDGKQRNRPAVSPDILGYMVTHSSGFDNPDLDSSLLVAGRYDGNGFFLRKDNYLEKLPMFCASRYITYHRAWTERGRIMKSADGAERFHADVKSGKLMPYLLKCLLFTSLEMQNHMRTLWGSDGRFSRNELCLDGTNGETVALHDLKRLIPNEREKVLFGQWEKVLIWAERTDGYDASLTYGVYQIHAELDTFREDDVSGERIYDFPELHSALTGLKTSVKEYYLAEIVPPLFEYEFLK